MEKKAIVLLGVLGVSFSAIFVKYTTAPSAVIALYRMFFAAAGLLPVVWIKCRDEIRQLEKRTVLMCFLSGIFLACHFALYFQSLAYTSIASSTVLVDTEVFFVAIISILFMKEKISRVGRISILLTFAGSVILALGDRSASSNAIYGDILAVSGAFFVALYTLIGRLEAQGRVFVIRPEIPCVSRTERDLEKLEDFYWHGFAVGEKVYPALKEWMAQREECVSRKRLLVH